VKSSAPDDLVFQSVKDGKPMRDNNVLTRFLKPAARKIGLGFANWRSLRTSRATWMIEAGANPKDVQGQMRHSRIQTTLDIYAQFVPESQRRAVEQTSKMATERIAHAHAVRGVGEGGIPVPDQSIKARVLHHDDEDVLKVLVAGTVILRGQREWCEHNKTYEQTGRCDSGRPGQTL
jgi:Phage integrase family